MAQLLAQRQVWRSRWRRSSSMRDSARLVTMRVIHQRNELRPSKRSIEPMIAIQAS
ncbi:MAG: hypothetical protein AAF211_04620 [Myxococcota bacterium]